MAPWRGFDVGYGELGVGGWTGTLLVSCALTVASCGKKGPPLVPFVHTPAAAEIASARRIGDDVYVTVRVPARNIDESSPASVQQIEVYGVTAAAAPQRGAPFLSVATRVATIPVARSADPGDDSGTVIPDPTTGALQGESVTVRDSLSADEMAPVSLPATETAQSETASAAVDVARAPQRFYMAVPFSRRGAPGPPSDVVAVPLVPPPSIVATVDVSMSGNRILVQWEPSAGLVGWLLERPLPKEVAPVEESGGGEEAPAAGRTAYNVYRRVAPDPLAPLVPAAQPAPWTNVVPEPVNAKPLPALTFEDEVTFDGRERCYHVRAIRGSGPTVVESEPSDTQCISPSDTEPPAPPSGIASDTTEGAVTIYWDPNSEPDLAGYLVLRREAGDATLLPLTTTRETRYVDKSVVPGRTYTYVVRAIDSRLPLPNTSAPVEVTETAR